MNKTEFYEQLVIMLNDNLYSEVGGKITPNGIEINGKTYHSISDCKFFKIKIKDGYLVIKKIEMGRASGGNCWDDTIPTYYSSDVQIMDFDKELTDICEKFCPNIPFIAFNKIKHSLFKYEDYTDYEYYGNYTNYKLCITTLDELVDALFPYVENA